MDGSTYAKQLVHDVAGNFRNCELWAALQQDRKFKMHLSSHNSFGNRPNKEAEEPLKTTKRFSRELGQWISKEVSEKGTKRQRAYYAHNFGTEVSRNIVGSDAYFRSQRQNLLTMIQPENQGPPNGMITYVCNHQAAEILAFCRAGPLRYPALKIDLLTNFDLRH